MSEDQNNPVVLVIDDEDYLADLIATALEIDNYTVYVAYNGRDGLARARELIPDLVIIDIMLPYLNGNDLVMHFQETEQLRNVPVILMSAGAQPRHRLPHVQFISKPLDMDALINLVNACIQSPGPSHGA